MPIHILFFYKNEKINILNKIINPENIDIVSIARSNIVHLFLEKVYEAVCENNIILDKSTIITIDNVTETTLNEEDKGYISSYLNIY